MLFVVKEVESGSMYADCAWSYLLSDCRTEKKFKIMKLVQKTNMSQTALVVTAFRACSAITRVAAGSQ